MRLERETLLLVYSPRDGRLALPLEKIGGITYEDPHLSTRGFHLGRHDATFVSYCPIRFPTQLPNLACSAWRRLDLLTAALVAATSLILG